MTQVNSGQHQHLIARLTKRLLPLILLTACYVAPAPAQDTHTPQLPAPPPLRAVSQSERTQLDQTDDRKARIRKTIELASVRLQRAEELVSQQKYDNALMELGGYLALIEDSLKFLGRMDSDRGKTRDLYKRLELALRADGPRLLALRRGAPLEYAIRIKEAEEFARAGRTEALNSFYGHTVEREGKQKPQEDMKPKDNPNKPERLP